MKSNNVSIAALAVIVLALAWLLYSNPSQQASPDGPAKEYQTAVPSKVSNEELSELLNTPGPNASLAVVTEYSKKVAAAAVKSESLELTGCAITPNVMFVNVGKPFVLTNRDEVEHKLVHEFFTLNAATQSETKITLEVSPGVYGYVCDQGPPVGIFFVID